MLLRSLKDWIRTQFASNPAGMREVLRPNWRLAPLEARRVLDADVTFDPATQVLLIANFTDSPGGGGGGAAPELRISDQLVSADIDATRLVLTEGERFDLSPGGGGGGGGSGGGGSAIDFNNDGTTDAFLSGDRSTLDLYDSFLRSSQVSLFQIDASTVDPLPITLLGPVNLSNLASFQLTTGQTVTLDALQMTGDLAVTGSLIRLTGNIHTTTGTQAWQGPVQLDSPSDLITLTAGNLTFQGAATSLNGATDGVAQLRVVSSGIATFEGPLGTSQRLRSVDISATGGIALSGGAVRTSEDQLYSGPVTLRSSPGNTRLEGRDITFSGAGSSINQAGSTPEQLQLVSSRIVRLEGAVGN
ncbi:MAG: hypothetical protein ACKOJF_21370, partial [Planctomycetaceae bacterium]